MRQPSKAIPLLLAFASLTLLLGACAQSRIVMVLNEGKPKTEIAFAADEHAHGVVVKYEKMDEKNPNLYVTDIRILHCSRPQQDKWQKSAIKAEASTAYKTEVTAKAAADIARESRLTSNHTNTSILVEYAFYRVCELIVSGAVAPEQADKLLKTLLESAGAAYDKSSGYAGSQADIEKGIKEFLEKAKASQH